MASVNEDPSKEHVRSVERRTILKAAAWTVPTVVIATASPASANASGTMAATSASADQLANSRRVRFTVTFGGTSPGAHTVTFNSVTGDAGPWTGLPETRTIPDGGGSRFFQARASSDPAGANVVISYTVQGHGSGTIAASVPD